MENKILEILVGDWFEVRNVCNEVWFCEFFLKVNKVGLEYCMLDVFFYFEVWWKGWYVFLLEFRWLLSWILNFEDWFKIFLYKFESLFFLKGLSGYLVFKW